MRIVPGLALAALAFAPPAAGQSGEAPCSAMKTAALPPCDAAAAKPAAPVLATLDGAPLGASDLDEGLQKRVATVDADAAAARRGALEAEIADVRLHLEAERRGVPFRDFWEAEVLRKTPPVSEAEIKEQFEEAKSGFAGKTLEDLRPMLASSLLAEHRVRREAEVAASLETRFPASPGADPNAAGLAPDALLAMVGGRRVTVFSAAVRLDAAAYGVRRDLYYDVADAVAQAAAKRLLKAEALARGVTPEELEKQKVKIGEGHTVQVRAELPPPPVLDLDVAGAPARGRADAPVTVVEYADFECPHCSKAWLAAEEALRPYGDRVRFVYRSFPLPFHEHALKAAEAARAADAQGRFFETAALLFRNQKALDTSSLKKYAAQAGCDPPRFDADLDSSRFTADVLLEARAGGRAGIVGTPMFFVNGVWVRWEATDVKGIRSAVDAALAKAAPPIAKAAFPP